MIVYLNEKKIETFAGARVKDALLKYSKEKYRDALSDKIRVTDIYDNTVHLEGELSDDQRLYLQTKKESLK